MNKKLSTFLLLIFCLALILGFGFYNSSSTKAQTQSNTQRSRQVSPTPTPKTKSIGDLGAPPPLPQFDEKELEIKVELVNLDVRVVDRNNRPISNLRENDFKIFEDSQPQKIEFFSQSEVPTNYSLVIDNSGSLRSQLDKVIEAGKIMVNANRKDDETSVIRFIDSSKIETKQDFTSNKEDIFYALDNLYVEGGQTAIIDAVYLAVESVDDYKKSNVRNNRKRRAIVLVSDGEDRNSFYNETQLFQLLREADVQIYTIGFVGELDKDGSLIRKSPQKKARTFLERLAQETGGKSYFPENVSELNGIAQDISSELRTQYSIGYVPSNDRKDGTFRSIKVMINDGPNAQKRIPITRNGRVAEKQ
ncbi:MAG: VWA domain-containing protein [Pyrinomonadaceae bacterium]